MRTRVRRDAIAIMVASFVAACFLLCASLVEAAYLRDVPQVLVQPDGTRIECFASGDEFYHWLHDADGFVIVRDPESGYWVWAEKDDGNLAPTKHVVGRIPPRLLDIEPRIVPDRSFLKSERLELFSSPPAEPAPSTGSMENLVIFIRFSGEAEFTDPLSGYETDFNSTSGGSSMKAYFTEVSYNQLTINSTFYP